MHHNKTDEIFRESETEQTLDKNFLEWMDSIHEPNPTKQMAVVGW
jgi:hypothetical protein